jgi:autotransporter translocation and assembly factor TamB
MRFFIKYLLIIVFASLVIAAYLACCTTEGLLFDLHYIAQLLPGKLKIEKISGTLLSGFSLQGISYQAKEEKINLQSLTTRWYPKQLLHRKLVIDSLLLEQPQITFFDTGSTSGTITLDDFAFLRYITVRHLAIHQLNIKKSGVEFNLTGELKNRWDFHWKLSIPTCHIFHEGWSGSFIGSGSIKGERSFPFFNVAMQGDHLKIAEEKINKLVGEAHIGGIQSKINSSIHLTATQLEIENHPIKKIDLTILGKAAYKKHALSAQSQVLIEQQPVLFLDANLPDFSDFTNLEQPLIAILKLNFINLAALHNAVPEIEHPQGILKGTININGTIAKPKITGAVYLTQGQLTIPALGIHPTEMTMEAILKENILALNGSFHSGKGTAQIQGNIDLNKPDFPATFVLQGNDLNAVDLPKFKVMLSPHLKINLVYPKVQLQGKIFIPEAAIKLKDFINTVALPEETVFVGQPENKKLSFLSGSDIKVELELGQNIFFTYKELETYLKGKLLITQMPNSPTTGTGEITAIHGKYSIYGQDLVIKTGRLIFAGNVLTDPGLQIEATRKVKDVNPASDIGSMPSLDNGINTEVTVGIRILGTLNNPQITLFSIPIGLTQAQILSSLGGEGSALIGALSALSPGISNAGGLMNKFTKMLGSTEINIASVQTFDTATNQMQSTPSFVVGKKISQKLSLHYSIGIFNPVSVLNVRYQLNKHWAIQSETSTIDNGADILYGFERP